jgi:hypothetical protein
MDDPKIKEILSRYIAVDDELVARNKESKDLKAEKKSLEEDIKEYMETNGLDKVELDSGSIRMTTSVQQKKLSKKDLLPVLIQHDVSDEKVNILVAELFDTQPEEIKTKVVRSKT